MTVTKLTDGVEQADFRYDFALDSKALIHEVDENGDLWIEGYASDWGVDRQDEAFEPGSFERGLKSFLERNPIMLYHHQYDKALGQFVDARVDGNGLWVKGRVDAPAPGSWAEDVFNKIRKGTIKAFSVGGIFRRRNTEKGPRIYDVDLGEISVTPFPVNPRTTFAVVAKKAFDTAEPVAEENATDHDTAVPQVTPEVAPTEVNDDKHEEGNETVRERADEAAGGKVEEPTDCAECAARAEAQRKEEEEAKAQEEMAELMSRLEALSTSIESVGQRFYTRSEPTEQP